MVTQKASPLFIIRLLEIFSKFFRRWESCFINNPYPFRLVHLALQEQQI